jgi:hypothetical protein
MRSRQVRSQGSCKKRLEAERESNRACVRQSLPDTDYRRATYASKTYDTISNALLHRDMPSPLPGDHYGLLHLRQKDDLSQSSFLRGKPYPYANPP